MALTEMQKRERAEYLEQNLTITECSQRQPYVFHQLRQRLGEGVQNSRRAAAGPTAQASGRTMIYREA